MLPYRTTAQFDETSLPAALRREHRTKSGVWGIIRVLEGEVRYVIVETGREQILTPERPGLVKPEEFHFVEPLGAIRMQVEFYNEPPQI